MWVHTKEDLDDKKARKAILARWYENDGLTVGEIEDMLCSKFEIKLSESSIRRIVKTPS